MFQWARNVSWVIWKSDKERLLSIRCDIDQNIPKSHSGGHIDSHVAKVQNIARLLLLLHHLLRKIKLKRSSWNATTNSFPIDLQECFMMGAELSR